MTVQCINTLTGRFVTITQEENTVSSTQGDHNGIEVCDLHVYGKGRDLLKFIMITN